MPVKTLIAMFATVTASFAAPTIAAMRTCPRCPRAQLDSVRGPSGFDMLSLRTPARWKIRKSDQLSVSDNHAPKTNKPGVLELVGLSAKELPCAVIFIVRDTQDWSSFA